MHALAEDNTRLLACPSCSVPQKVRFVDGSVGVEQKCVSCGTYVRFQMPSPYMWVVARWNELLARRRW